MAKKDTINVPEPDLDATAPASAAAAAPVVATPELISVMADSAAEALSATSPAIATPEQNAGLVHSDPNAPESTRDDYLDAGVPMLPGSPAERQGPEDALGIGPKRGDYTSRVGPADYNPHVSVFDPESGRIRLVPQRELAKQIGEVPGAKGGVDTNPMNYPGYASGATRTGEQARREMLNREMGLNSDGSPIAPVAPSSPASSSAPTNSPAGPSVSSAPAAPERPAAPRTNATNSDAPQDPEPGSGVEKLIDEKKA